MKNNTLHSNKSNLLTTILFLVVFQFLATGLAFAEIFEEDKAFHKTTQARLAVEHAWETYHHAALGGTLASPTIQTELEMNLHKSRALLAEAYEAEDQGNAKTVDKLIDKIMNITQQVIVESREPKK